MLVLFAILLIPVLSDICEGKGDSITWQILKLPIKFGKDVTLFCNASVVTNCCTNTVTWMRDFDVIYHHEASTNSSKYVQTKRSDGFLFVIKNFDEGDINHRYTCLYDFFSYSADLSIDRHNFQYSPNKHEVKANINRTSDNIIFADVMFEKVYPLPECIFITKKENITTNVTIEEEDKAGIFYKIKLYLVCETHHTKCMDSVGVLCTFGNDKMVVQEENISKCPDMKESLESSDQKILLVFIYSGLTLCTTVTVSVLIWKKRPWSSRTIRFCIEGSGTNTTRSENWRGADSGIVEESEKTPLLPSSSDTTNNERCTTNNERCTTNNERRSNNNVENPIHGSNTSSKRTTISAQKYKDVTNIVNHGIEHDPSYVQKIITNTKINIALLRKKVLCLKAFRYLFKMSIKEGQIGTLQLTGPAQKEKDVLNMVNYAKIHDKDYAEKLVSDTLINNALRQKPIPSLKSCPSVSAPPSTNASVSDVDVFKGSSWIPTWGARKRSRISITSKQEPSNE